MISMPESKTKRKRAARKGWKTREADARGHVRRVTTTARRYVGRARKRVAKPKLVQMALLALAGWGTGKAIDSTFDVFIESKFPQLAAAAAAKGMTTGNFIGKLLGAGLGGDAVYKSVKSGKVSGKALNLELPYAVGTFMDMAKGTASSTSSSDLW